MELKHTAQRTGRLSSFLKEELHMSTGLMNRLKWQQRLFVNGLPVHTDYAVQPGDVITAALDEEKPDYPAQDGELDILYEDEHILVLDKPAGMLVHPSRSQNENTLANFVQGYYRRTGQCSACHPITRLDRDTYGVVLMAKNAHIHAFFTAAQEEGRLQKLYHALVFGAPATDEGIIDAPIARLPLPSLLRCVHPEGKPSRTRFRVLARENGRSLLELQPLTGRTHQLRLHCAHMGFPILGDPQYCTESSRSASKGLISQRLCAKSLTFPHPVSGEIMTVVSKQSANL